MQNRRFEVRSFRHLGETIEYAVQIVEPCPAPYEYPKGVDAIGCNPTPARFVEGQGWVALDPTPEPEKRCPTREEYIRAFFAAQVGPVPACVEERYNGVHSMLWAVVKRFEHRGVPRRIRKAHDRVVLSCVGIYDHGTITRLAYYVGRHDARWEAHTANPGLYPAGRWEREGEARPMAIAAVVAR